MKKKEEKTTPLPHNIEYNYDIYQKSIDKIIDELNNIKSDISEVRQQTAMISEKINNLELAGMTNHIENLDLPGSAARIEDAINRLLTENTLPTPLETSSLSAKEKSPKNKIVKFISNILFYSCMLILIIGAISFAQNQDPEKSILGYRYYYIKTPSMEPVLPVGSVVFTKAMPSENIRVGDDITVYLGDDKNQTYLTHRVVEIIEDEAGELLFRTKGVNNKQNDTMPFNSKLVVGKVVLCVPMMGTIMLFVQSQLVFIIVLFVLLMALSFMLRLLFTKEKPKQSADKTKKSEIPDEKELIAEEETEVSVGSTNEIKTLGDEHSPLQCSGKDTKGELSEETKQ